MHPLPGKASGLEKLSRYRRPKRAFGSREDGQGNAQQHCRNAAHARRSVGNSHESDADGIHADFRPSRHQRRHLAGGLASASSQGSGEQATRARAYQSAHAQADEARAYCQTDEWGAVMSACKHEELWLWSGGFYLACGVCRKRWVAIKDEGTDAATDHEPRFEPLVQCEKVYRQTDRPF